VDNVLIKQGYAVDNVLYVETVRLTVESDTVGLHGFWDNPENCRTRDI